MMPLWVYRAELTLLAVSNAPALFRHLYGLPWYGGLLRQWAGDSLAAATGTVRDLCEIGCGPGDLLHDLVQPSQQATGLDASAAMLRAARPHPLVRFQSGRLPDLPLADGSQDVVLAASVLNCVPDPLASLAGMVCITRIGGVVSVLVPTGPRASVGDLLRDAGTLGLAGRSAAALVHWLRMARGIDPAEAARWFTAAGLQQVTITPYLKGRVSGIRGRVS